MPFLPLADFFLVLLSTRPPTKAFRTSYFTLHARVWVEFKILYMYWNNHRARSSVVFFFCSAFCLLLYVAVVVALCCCDFSLKYILFCSTRIRRARWAHGYCKLSILFSLRFLLLSPHDREQTIEKRARRTRETICILRVAARRIFAVCLLLFKAAIIILRKLRNENGTQWMKKMHQCERWMQILQEND